MQTLKNIYSGGFGARSSSSSKQRPLWRKALGLYSEQDVAPERIESAVCVVTGDSGIALELCKSLCTLGAGAIFVLSRNSDKLHTACHELKAVAMQSCRERVERVESAVSAAAIAGVLSSTSFFSATQIFPIVCDLENAGEVARAIFSIEARAPHVDLLFLVAGRYVDAPFHAANGWGAQGETTSEQDAWAVESTFAANHYGHALLASMLLPKMMCAQDMLAAGALHRPAATAVQAQEQPTTTEASAPPAAAAAPTATTTTTTKPHPHGITAITGHAAAAQRPSLPGGQQHRPQQGPAMLRLPHGARPLPRARVVIVASQAEMFAPAAAPFLTDDPTGMQLKSRGMDAYARSKLMAVLWTRELARRIALGEAKSKASREAAALAGDMRRANATGLRPCDCVLVHPGLVDSPLMAKTSPSDYPLTALISRAGAAIVGLTPRQASTSVLFAGTSPELDGKGGSFVGPSYLTNLAGATVREPQHPGARDPDVWRLCWDATSNLLFRQFRHAADNRVAARLHAVLGGHNRALPAHA